MVLNKTVILAAATLVAAVVIDYEVQPALAQYAAQSNQVQDRGAQSSDRDREPQREEQSCSRLDRYDEGYRTGYSAGYEAARNTQRYDERPEVIAESPPGHVDGHLDNATSSGVGRTDNNNDGALGLASRREFPVSA